MLAVSGWAADAERLAAASDPATNTAFDQLLDEMPPWSAYPEYAGPSANGKQAPVGGALRAGDIRSLLLTPTDIDGLADPTWLIDSYIPTGSLATIYGRPGSYKTFIALDWACSVASGTWWMGHQVAQGPVLYVMAEGVGGLRRRKQAWEVGRSVHLRDMPLNVYPKAVNLLDVEWAEGIAIIAQELGVVLTVIDTVARCFPGGEENSGKDMGRLITSADLIRERSKGAVALVHHTPLESSRLRGHSSLEGAVDANISVEYDGTTIKLTVAKQKDDAPAAELLLHHETVGQSIVLRSGSAPNTDAIPERALAALKALAEIELEGGVSTTQWCESAISGGLSRASFFRLRKHLCETKLVSAVSGAEGAASARYMVTDQGKDVIWS